MLPAERERACSLLLRGETVRVGLPRALGWTAVDSPSPALERSMAEVNPRGRIVWHELLTPDPAAATAFYPSITGWKVQAYEQDPSYQMWSAGDAMIGGVMKMPEGMNVPPHWVMYVAVPDVDASQRQAASLGATVMKPATDIPNIGRFAVLNDPQGGMFALFKSTGQEPGHEGKPNIGEFSWHELATTDAAAAMSFYHQMFGWNEMSSFDMGPDNGGMYRMFGRNGVTLGGMYRRSANVPASRWLPYVRVKNVDAATASATARGATLISGPMDVPGGDRVSQLRDPAGAYVALHMTAAAAAPARPAAKAPAKKAAKKVVKKAAAKKVAKKAAKKTAKKAAKRSAPKKAAKSRTGAKPAKRRAPARKAAKKGGKKKRR